MINRCEYFITNKMIMYVLLKITCNLVGDLTMLHRDRRPCIPHPAHEMYKLFSL